MRRLDGYLSRVAQGVEPSAMVYCESGNGERWTLEVPGKEPTDLGDSFDGPRGAHSAVLAWAKAQRARLKAQPSSRESAARADQLVREWQEHVGEDPETHPRRWLKRRIARELDSSEQLARKAG